MVGSVSELFANSSTSQGLAAVPLRAAPKTMTIGGGCGSCGTCGPCGGAKSLKSEPTAFVADFVSQPSSNLTSDSVTVAQNVDNRGNDKGDDTGFGDKKTGKAKKQTGGEDGDSAADRQKALDPDAKYSEAEREQLQELKKRDAEVRRHEAAHASAGGQHAGSPSYTYQQGPDGQRYAIGGEVQIDVAEVPGDPAATIAKMEQVKRAALAPNEPSSQDQRVAQAATRTAQKAQQERLQQTQAEIQEKLGLRDQEADKAGKDENGKDIESKIPGAPDKADGKDKKDAPALVGLPGREQSRDGDERELPGSRDKSAPALQVVGAERNDDKSKDNSRDSDRRQEQGRRLGDQLNRNLTGDLVGVQQGLGKTKDQKSIDQLSGDPRADDSGRSKISEQPGVGLADASTEARKNDKVNGELDRLRKAYEARYNDGGVTSGLRLFA